MPEKNKKKNKLGWLWKPAFIVLLLVVGLGPIYILVSSTRDGGLLDFFRSSDRHEEIKQEQPDPEQHLQADPYTVHYLYRYCKHGQVFTPGSIPPDLPLPPVVLAEMAVALSNSDTSIENLMDYIADAGGWFLANARTGAGQLVFTLTHLDDLCPDCRGNYYLGIFGDDYIAIYEGIPPGGKLHQLTEFKVKDVFRYKLEEGYELESLDDLDTVLQGFTS